MFIRSCRSHQNVQKNISDQSCVCNDNDNKKICALIFSTTIVWNISHYTKNWARYDKNVVGLYAVYPIFCHILMNLEICGEIFEKYSNIKFYENPSSGPKLFHADGRADGQTNTTKLIVAFSHFCELTKNHPQYLRAGWRKHAARSWHQSTFSSYELNYVNKIWIIAVTLINVAWKHRVQTAIKKLFPYVFFYCNFY
jgi:hypothetical protein